jgi:hypothetical protein
MARTAFASCGVACSSRRPALLGGVEVAGDQLAARVLLQRLGLGLVEAPSEISVDRASTAS